jgi:hypothetical protein
VCSIVDTGPTLVPITLKVYILELCVACCVLLVYFFLCFHMVFNNSSLFVSMSNLI